MPPRSSWKGFIKLSLLSVPVKAYAASVSGSSIRLNQLHQGCHSPVKYRKVCPIHGELATEAIVSGYEYAKGQKAGEQRQRLRPPRFFFSRSSSRANSRMSSADTVAGSLPQARETQKNSTMSRRRSPSSIRLTNERSRPRRSAS